MIAENLQDHIQIRKYQPKDREEIRDICRRTAFRKMGADAFFEDWNLVVDYWSFYYTDYVPGTIWVAEYQNRISGYLFGCEDTHHYLKIMAGKIIPSVVSKAIWRWLRGMYTHEKSRLFLKWLLLKSWREAPRIPVQKFPAHFHCNLLPVVYHKQLLTRFVLLFIDHLDERGIGGIHMQTLESQSGGLLKRLVSRSGIYLPGWEYFYDEKPTDFFRDILGVEKKMVNCILGSSMLDFKKVILSVQQYSNVM